MIRLGGQSATVVADRLVKATLLFSQNAEMDVRQVVFRLGLDSALIMADRFVNAPLFAKDHALPIQVGARLGSLYIDQGSYEAACNLLREVVDKIPHAAEEERFGTLVAASVACRASLARALGELGRFREAMQVGDEAVQLAEEIGHSFSQVYAYLFVANALFRKGDFQSSLFLATRARSACQATQTRLLMPLSAAALGYALIKTGKPTDGLALLEGAVRQAKDHDCLFQLSQQTAWLAEGYLHAGDTQSALQHAQQAVAIAQENGEKGEEAWA